MVMVPQQVDGVYQRHLFVRKNHTVDCALFPSELKRSKGSCFIVLSGKDHAKYAIMGNHRLDGGTGADMEEKRAHRRKLMQQPADLAELLGEQWQPVVLLDLSSHGISFTHEHEMVNGTTHSIRFGLPGSSERHTVQVRVVNNGKWGVPSGFRVGAAFTSTDARTQAATAAFLAIES
jgi:hypothetical protein